MNRTVVLLTAAAMLVVVQILSAIPAFADANPTASCLGIGGSGDKALRAEDAAFVIEDAAAKGISPGAEYRVFAQEHLGSIDACFG
jgi:hypothetical protein